LGYNIRGWLKGINTDYANGANETIPGTGGHWFGMELNYDWGFDNKQYNGNIAGIKWRSKGDGVQRAYGFGYDKVNRLLSADFSQGTGSVYADDPRIDFDVQMGNGTDAASAYDENGNILAMKQRGLKGLSSDLIDDLSYTYLNPHATTLSGGDSYQYFYTPVTNTGTNLLYDVTDDKNDPDSKLGDFNDQTVHYRQGYTVEKPGTYIDGWPEFQPSPILAKYMYDFNGNLILDMHKGLANFFDREWDSPDNYYDGIVYPGISYNHLNLPNHITVFNMDPRPTQKGDITYIYDAIGNKLAKQVIDFGNAANNHQKKYTNTTYIGGFIYESSGPTTDALTNAGQLQFFSMEEGRIRPITLTDGTLSYAFDYMIKDHLGNVRTVLTDEQKQDKYIPASMEPANSDEEKKYYGKIDETRAHKSDITCYPGSDPYTDPNEYVSRVNGTDNKMGPGITLKVMAGDKFNVRVSSWYKTGLTTPQIQPVVPTVLKELADALASGIGVTPGNHISLADLQDGTVLTPGIADFFTQRDISTAPGKPKAFVNWILFDEQFKMVQSSSGAEQVPDESAFGDCPHEIIHAHNILDKPIDKNGYLYVYVSNETPNIDVFFDNLQVTHIRGPLLEETHYYPFGLTMAGISSKALGFGGGENRRKFNGGNELQSKEFSDGSGLETYDAVHRMYDPQIGRFMQADPMAEVFSDWSPYVYANNNPILLNDPLGLAGDTAWKTLQTVTVTPKPKAGMITINNSPGTGYRKNPNYNPFINNSGPSYIRYQAWNNQDPAHPEQMSYGQAALGLAAWLPWGAAVKGVGWAFRLYKARQLIEASLGAARYLKLFTPLNELDVVTTLYRGTTGSEAGSSVLFLTEDAAVAATYVKNGGQVVSYDVTQFALKSLQASGELSLKTGIHGTTGAISTEYMFQGKDLVEALNSIAK